MIEQEEKKEQESVVYPVIEFDIEDLQVVSVNDMYSVNRGRGRAIRRSSKYEQFSTNMKWQLRQKVPRKYQSGLFSDRTAQILSRVLRM